MSISTLRLSLYSQKKGQLSIKEYLAKIKNLCDKLASAGYCISAQEHNSTILAGLPIEYESINVVASAMPASIYLLAEMLVDCEARQQDLVLSMPFQVNMAQQSGSNAKHTDQFDSGSRPPYRGGGSRSFRRRGRGRHFAHNKPQFPGCFKHIM
ncbi:hypothetical protein PVK06_043519 [Gossypium arboreum]|uniref:Uncharacterized protein n=1 Tax=Gossypium arboreum TaxID=29729 RepID=A0ABR0MNP7_GOSAR|nr:hypothetical protein PVK06_043519 [Gossypium arboreum]